MLPLDDITAPAKIVIIPYYYDIGYVLIRWYYTQNQPQWGDTCGQNHQKIDFKNLKFLLTEN